MEGQNIFDLHQIESFSVSSIIFLLLKDVTLKIFLKFQRYPANGAIVDDNRLDIVANFRNEVNKQRLKNMLNIRCNCDPNACECDHVFRDGFLIALNEFRSQIHASVTLTMDAETQQKIRNRTMRIMGVAEAIVYELAAQGVDPMYNSRVADFISYDDDDDY